MFQTQRQDRCDEKVIYIGTRSVTGEGRVLLQLQHEETALRNEPHRCKNRGYLPLACTKSCVHRCGKHKATAACQSESSGKKRNVNKLSIQISQTSSGNSVSSMNGREWHIKAQNDAPLSAQSRSPFQDYLINSGDDDVAPGISTQVVVLVSKIPEHWFGGIDVLPGG